MSFPTVGKHVGPVRCLAAGALVASAMFGSAADAQSIDEYLAAFRGLDPAMQVQAARAAGTTMPQSCQYAETTAFWAVIKAIHDEREFQRHLRGSASLGFQGDEVAGESQSSGITNQYKVEVGLDLRRGVYPGEFKFANSVGVRLVGGKFEEDVSKLEMAYDYYAHEYVQPFVYVSRFTDNFLNIDQRYEVGAGVFFGGTLGIVGSERHKQTELRKKLPVLDGRSGDTAELIDHLFNAIGLLEDGAPPGVSRWYQCYVALVGAAKAAETTPADVERNLRNMFDDTLVAREKRFHILRAGVVLGLQSESEQATVTSVRKQTVFDQNGQPLDDLLVTKQDLRVPAAHRFRWVLRPTISVQPSSRWEFSGRYYWKLPVGDGDVLRPGRGGPDLVRDKRRDIEADASFKVTDKALGQPGNVSITLSYRQYSDDAPPFCARVRGTTECEDFAGLLRRSASGTPAIDTVSAPGKHEIFSLKFSINW